MKPDRHVKMHALCAIVSPALHLPQKGEHAAVDSRLKVSHCGLGVETADITLERGVLDRVAQREEVLERRACVCWRADLIEIRLWKTCQSTLEE